MYHVACVFCLRETGQLISSTCWWAGWVTAEWQVIHHSSQWWKVLPSNGSHSPSAWYWDRRDGILVSCTRKEELYLLGHCHCWANSRNWAEPPLIFIHFKKTPRPSAWKSIELVLSQNIAVLPHFDGKNKCLMSSLSWKLCSKITSTLPFLFIFFSHILTFY